MARETELESGPYIRTLAQLVQDPALLEPPQPVARNLAWEGRVTMLAGREKSGKSTLASAAAAAVSAGFDFLGKPVRQGHVLYCSLEEHLGELVRRLLAFEAEADHVHVVDRLASPLADLELAILSTMPKLVVLDSLAAFVRTLDIDPNSSAGWTPILLNLSRMARENECAFLFLHHARKSDGRYRDSTAIGASVDMLLEMEASKCEYGRKFRAQGRWRLGEFEVHLVCDERGEPFKYELVGEGLPLHLQILGVIERKPGITKKDLPGSVTARAEDVDAEVRRLGALGEIENLGTASLHAWYLADKDPDTIAERAMSSRNDCGQGVDTPSDTVPVRECPVPKPQ